MKKTNSDNQTFKLVASHAFVVAIFTNPYFMYILGDLYKIATRDASDVVVNQSLTASMSLLSTTALLVSITAFALFILKNRK